MVKRTKPFDAEVTVLREGPGMYEIGGKDRDGPYGVTRFTRLWLSPELPSGAVWVRRIEIDDRFADRKTPESREPSRRLRVRRVLVRIDPAALKEVEGAFIVAEDCVEIDGEVRSKKRLLAGKRKPLGLYTWEQWFEKAYRPTAIKAIQWARRNLVGMIDRAPGDDLWMQLLALAAIMGPYDVRPYEKVHGEAALYDPAAPLSTREQLCSVLVRIIDGWCSARRPVKLDFGRWGSLAQYNPLACIEMIIGWCRIGTAAQKWKHREEWPEEDVTLFEVLSGRDEFPLTERELRNFCLEPRGRGVQMDLRPFVTLKDETIYYPPV